MSMLGMTSAEWALKVFAWLPYEAKLRSRDPLVRAAGLHEKVLTLIWYDRFLTGRPRGLS